MLLIENGIPPPFWNTSLAPSVNNARFGISFSVTVSNNPSLVPFVEPDCDNSITSMLLPPL